MHDHPSLILERRHKLAPALHHDLLRRVGLLGGGTFEGCIRPALEALQPRGRQQLPQVDASEVGQGCQPAVQEAYRAELGNRKLAAQEVVPVILAAMQADEPAGSIGGVMAWVGWWGWDGGGWERNERVTTVRRYLNAVGCCQWRLQAGGACISSRGTHPQSSPLEPCTLPPPLASQHTMPSLVNGGQCSLQSLRGRCHALLRVGPQHAKQGRREVLGKGFNEQPGPGGSPRVRRQQRGAPVCISGTEVLKDDHRLIELDIPIYQDRHLGGGAGRRVEGGVQLLQQRRGRAGQVGGWEVSLYLAEGNQGEVDTDGCTDAGITPLLTINRCSGQPRKAGNNWKLEHRRTRGSGRRTNLEIVGFVAEIDQRVSVGQLLLDQSHQGTLSIRAA